ncbi:MAG: hypothetical protein EBZ77_11430, partial [Chitinophagia bacterium]|nr:hypothetical protein [Chitinophagia bacterium]
NLTTAPSISRTADTAFSQFELKSNNQKFAIARFKYKILQSEVDGRMVDVFISSNATKENVRWAILDVKKRLPVGLNPGFSIAFWSDKSQFRSYLKGGDYKMFAFCEAVPTTTYPSSSILDFEYLITYNDGSKEKGPLEDLK